MTLVAARFENGLPEGPPPRTLEAEADHRIGNNLALIAAMLRLQSNDIAHRDKPIEPEEARSLLAETAARIESIGRLHRLLAGMNGEALIDVGTYLRDVTTSIADSLARPGQTVTSFELHPSCLLHAKKVVPLGLIVGEVVSNAIKYAHPSGIPTAISVGCTESQGFLAIEITDDGVGLPENFDPSTSGGLGLKLIRSLSGQISATPVFDSGPLGLSFRLNVPLHAS